MESLHWCASPLCQVQQRWLFLWLSLRGNIRATSKSVGTVHPRDITRATTLSIGQEKCSDLVLSSLVRARFCEVIAPKVVHGKSDLFLMGMLSLMDAILKIPMGAVVEGLALDSDANAELLGAKTGSKTPLSFIPELMVAREAGDWEAVTAQAKKLNLSLPFVNRAYSETMSWAHQITTAVPIK